MLALHPVCSMEMICHVNGPNRRGCCFCRIDTSTRRPPTARQKSHHKHVGGGEPFAMLKRGRNQGVVSSVANRKQQQQQQQQQKETGSAKKSKPDLSSVRNTRICCDPRRSPVGATQGDTWTKAYSNNDVV